VSSSILQSIGDPVKLFTPGDTGERGNRGTVITGTQVRSSLAAGLKDPGGPPVNAVWRSTSD